MDATLWLSEPLSDNILGYPLYTRSLAGTQFCTNTMWSNWFCYAQKGEKLFHFLMEPFCMDKWEKYIGKAQVHKLSYKFGQSNINDTNLQHIIDSMYQCELGIS